MATTPTRRESAPRFAWDETVEDLYDAWHRRVAAAELGHRLMADRMYRRYLLLGIPVVVFTTLVGTSAFASLQSTDAATIRTEGANPDLVLLIVGTISILAAVLSSLQTFLRYATRAERHRIASQRYETLRREMAETLALPREARGQPDRVLDSVRLRLDRYAKESPTIGERLWGKLTSTFQLSKVPPDPSRRGESVVIPEA